MYREDLLLACKWKFCFPWLEISLGLCAEDAPVRPHDRGAPLPTGLTVTSSVEFHITKGHVLQLKVNEFSPYLYFKISVTSIPLKGAFGKNTNYTPKCFFPINM